MANSYCIAVDIKAKVRVQKCKIEPIGCLVDLQLDVCLMKISVRFSAILFVRYRYKFKNQDKCNSWWIF